MSWQPNTYKWQLTYNSPLVRTANSHKVKSRTHTCGCIGSIYFMNQNMTSANSETRWRKQEDHAENPDAAGRGLKMLWARLFNTSHLLLYWHLVVVCVNCNITEQYRRKPVITQMVEISLLPPQKHCKTKKISVISVVWMNADFSWNDVRLNK